MAKINILKPDIYNKIAAGEVVERPSSVVKELIENSIDAGADSISIEISDGGISYIRISDNGCGMDKEDLTRAVMPHATSKIVNADDLFKINTLGFRGEALASIAAVSKMTLTSCSGEGGAFSLRVNGGTVEDISPCGRGQGTTTEIKDIFFNTPVRLKFLKKPKQEEKDVTYTVSQLILANPDISFTYIADGEQIFNTSNGLINAIYAVYGSEIAENLTEHRRSVGDISICGYIGKQGYGKHNRNYQTAIINGRVIANNIISTAVSQAYGTTLMKRTYPVYVLNIDMPIDQLDVNVHPNKREVRFKDSNKVFAAVYKFVMSALAEQTSYLKLSDSRETENNAFVKSTAQSNISNIIDKSSNNYEIAAKSEQITTYLANSNQVRQDYPHKLPEQYGNAAQDNSQKIRISNDTNVLNTKERQSSLSDKLKEKFSNVNTYVESAKTVRKTMVAQPPQYNRSTTDKSLYKMSSPLLEAVDKELSGDYTVIGQIFKTYLIIERKDRVYLIDQHAVHEKFIYDEYVKQVENMSVSSQQLLVPFVFDADSEQYEFIAKIIGELRAIGFEIEEFGGLNYKISAIPYVLTGLDLDAFFNDICNDKGKIGTIKLSDMLKENLMQRACKRAIKSGDRLSNANIVKLFGNMDNGIPMQCPHGRPAVLEYTRNDLDKLFKRII